MGGKYIFHSHLYMWLFIVSLLAFDFCRYFEVSARVSTAVPIHTYVHDNAFRRLLLLRKHFLHCNCIPQKVQLPAFPLKNVFDCLGENI